jgi:DNA processing protein
MARQANNAPFTDRQRIDHLRLIRSDHVGPVTCRRLIERFGSAAAALAALPDLARKGGRPALRIFSIADAEEECARLAACGGRLLVLGEADYPVPLAAIEDAPPVLALIGDGPLLQRPAVAVVGSRNASLNGRRFAERLAADLGRAGFTVVSGLARGIDAAAHRGALAAGTVAVMAGGVDVVYPEENTGLYRDIARTGAVVSEIAAGVAPQAGHFPRRNRLISGLAQAVVVVEAHLRSGSLITARLAGEQGREVLAVPGSPLDPRARGCNDLIRQGAALCEGVDDVLAVLGGAAGVTADPAPEPAPPGPPAPSPDMPADAAREDAARRELAELLSPTPVAVDALLRNCCLPPALVNTILLEWELAGRLERHAGNRVSLIIPSSGA